MSTVVIEPIGPSTSRATSAVSWGAIVAGAAAAAALSLVLLILGSGLGFAAASPWTFDSSSAATFGVATIIWISVTQLAASGLGGYLAGRLRTKWADAQRDEIFFRDTAHGFLAWAVASLVTAAVLTSAVGAIAGAGVKAAGAAAGGLGAGALSMPMPQSGGQANASGDDVGAMGYFVDSLFRTEGNVQAAGQAVADGQGPSAEARAQTPEQTSAYVAEVTRIFAKGLAAGSLPAEDARYVGQLVAERTSLSAADAEQRVRDTFAKVQGAIRDAEAAAKSAADDARKAAAYAALWFVVSLLIGAFVASFMATYGGRQRDN